MRRAPSLVRLCEKSPWRSRSVGSVDVNPELSGVHNQRSNELKVNSLFLRIGLPTEKASIALRPTLGVSYLKVLPFSSGLRPLKTPAPCHSLVPDLVASEITPPPLKPLSASVLF